MKKIFLSLICLCLAITSVFALAGCGTVSDAKAYKILQDTATNITTIQESDFSGYTDENFKADDVKNGYSAVTDDASSIGLIAKIFEKNSLKTGKYYNLSMDIFGEKTIASVRITKKSSKLVVELKEQEGEDYSYSRYTIKLNSKNVWKTFLAEYDQVQGTNSSTSSFYLEKASKADRKFNKFVGVATYKTESEENTEFRYVDETTKTHKSDNINNLEKKDANKSKIDSLKKSLSKVSKSGKSFKYNLNNKTIEVDLKDYYAE